MKLCLAALADTAPWSKVGVTLPRYDIAAARRATLESPRWLHFGAGNIFRGFIAGLADTLLDEGHAPSGVIAAELFDGEIVQKIYALHDNLVLSVTLNTDGSTRRAVGGSIAAGLVAADMDRLGEIFENLSLQMVSYTITEKGYAVTDMRGDTIPAVAADIQSGTASSNHAMSVTAALLLRRYKACAAPIAMVSMDNCSHNGDILREAVLRVAQGWVRNGHADNGFVEYLSDSARVSFPWSMIDKITPRPAEEVRKSLQDDGIEGMDAVVTAKGTYIAPFVNAEAPQYLVIEDAFPAGRPPLERAGVYFTDRQTVDLTERMKVTTCLNPLHTALAVFGCLLGYTTIWEEMRDPDLAALVRRIAYTEGLPVVVNPGIIDPRAFAAEVIDQRLTNPYIPDMPQRIATDTSQKIPIRFGETIKAYAASPTLSTGTLTAIPLAIAAWLRYLLGVDDNLQPMEVSPDPLLGELQAALSGIVAGKPDSLTNQLQPILSNPSLFGVNLYDAGLGDRVDGFFRAMLAGVGAVRGTLHQALEVSE